MAEQIYYENTIGPSLVTSPHNARREKNMRILVTNLGSESSVVVINMASCVGSYHEDG
jgi:hypothetical protein